MVGLKESKDSEDGISRRLEQWALIVKAGVSELLTRESERVWLSFPVEGKGVPKVSLDASTTKRRFGHKEVNFLKGSTEVREDSLEGFPGPFRGKLVFSSLPMLRGLFALLSFFCKNVSN